MLVCCRSTSTSLICLHFIDEIVGNEDFPKLDSKFLQCVDSVMPLFDFLISFTSTITSPCLKVHYDNVDFVLMASYFVTLELIIHVK